MGLPKSIAKQHGLPFAEFIFNGHEGGGTPHLRAKLDFLAATLAS